MRLIPAIIERFDMALSQRRNCMIVHLLMMPSPQKMMQDLTISQKITQLAHGTFMMTSVETFLVYLDGS